MSAPSTSPVCVQFRPEQLGLSSGTPVGSGAISHVMQCRLRCAAHPSLPVAVKIVSKLQVLQQGRVQSVMNEKAALQRLASHPYIARLYGTSQSEDELYYVLEWLPHGDLLQHIRRVHAKRIREYNDKNNSHNITTEARTRSTASAIPNSSTALRCLDFHDIQLITAQLILALTRAYEKGVVLRDLKPENVAFDEKHRACLLDFDTVDLDGSILVPEKNNGIACPPPCGDAADVEDSEADGTCQHNHPQANSSAATATTIAATPLQPSSAIAAAAPPRRRLTVSEIQSMRKKSANFCGTAQYVSPEMVGECKWSFSSDLWALGALVYEMAYGTHLFSGMSQFEVLRKVIQGSYVERANLFPPIDFGPLASDHGADSGRNFAALRDFIQQLLKIDPEKRLGVDRETHKFDEAALRSHTLFCGFAWDLVDEQLRTFRPRSFSASSTTVSAPKPSALRPGRSAFDFASEQRRSSQSDDDVPNAASVAAAAAAAEAALAALSEASVDPSPSLAAHYHIRPFNDPAYAEYVYRTTADANPFEQLFIRSTRDTANASENLKEGEGEAKGSEAASSPLPLPTGGGSGFASSFSSQNDTLAGEADTTATTPERSSNINTNAHRAASTTDEDDDVVDDVGMRYVGTRAHPDFQE